MAEAAGVLHRAAHPERQVQLWVDHHPGGADLALVRYPAAVGDDASGADACADRRADSGEPVELLGRGEACAAADDAAGLGEVDGGRVGADHLHHPGIEVFAGTGVRRIEFDDGGAIGAVGRVDAAHPDLQGGDERRGWRDGVHRQTTAAGQHHALGRYLHRPGEQRPVECGSETRCEVAAVGCTGNDDDRFAHQHRAQRRRPAGRLELAQLEAAHRAGLGEVSVRQPGGRRTRARADQ